MPRGNATPAGGQGTDPSGQGSGTGRGMGMGRDGGGRGRMGGNRPGSGPSGNCLCPNCGAKVAHQAGKPCLNIICPQCGSQMMRE